MVNTKKFELFTLIYFVLDAYYEDEVKTNENLNIVLSDMNPFIWGDCISGDPAMYASYSKFIGNREITLDNSLEIAKEYVKTIDFADVTEAFDDMTDEDWLPVCQEYLASEHKGADASK